MMRARRRLGERVAHAIERSKPDPFSSVVLTMPVFLVYHLGIVFMDRRNGVDLVSELTFELLEHSVLGYVGATLALSAALVLAMWLLRRRGRLRSTDPGWLAAESLCWASIMLVTVGSLTERVARALSSGGGGAVEGLGALEKLVMAAGAGFHEEAVFRALLIGGGSLVLGRAFGVTRRRALAIMLVTSSLAFALVHHLGPFGEPLAAVPLIFRTFAGLFLGGVYLARGFAIAVYTHAFYDSLVFFVL